jgi:glutamate dehydrogenase/leucine dehydrogenase
VSNIQSPELELAVNAISRVAEYLGLSDGEKEFLLRPDDDTTFQVPYLRARKRAWAPVSMIFFWPRPSRSGLQIHPHVNLEALRGLGLNLRAKHALWVDPEVGYIEGGGMVGFTLDRSGLTRDEADEAIRSLARALGNRVGAGVHVLAPDFGADQDTMAIMMDERAFTTAFQPDAFAGKPTLWGGRGIRELAAGFGTAVAAAVAADRLGLSLDGATAAVVGFGAAGAPAARYLAEQRARVVAAMNIHGAVIGRSLDVHALEQWVREERRDLTAFPTADAVPPDQAWDAVVASDVDVLVMAAKSGMITAEVARRIKARIVVEAVPASVTPDGEAALIDREKVVVPELIAGALGAYAGALELRGYDPEHIRRRLENKARDINHQVYQVAQETGLSPRTAAWAIGLKRLLQHARASGRI